jgi:vitamin B12 transporter
MKNSFRARGFAPALSVLSLAVAASLHAQTVELEPVVVSATRIEQKLSDVIPSASVITREEIERSQAATFIDLIQGQSGVEIGRNGGPGSVASIFMRGQESKNVAVFIDGTPVQRDAFGVLKLVDIPPSQIEKVEILRGNMGAIHGESAVGGVINIYTRTGATFSGPTASVAYGSRNTSDAAAGYSIKGSDYRLGISLQRFETDGFSAMNSRQDSLVNPEDDSFNRESIFVNGETTPNSKVAFGFQSNYINSAVAYDRNLNRGLQYDNNPPYDVIADLYTDESTDEHISFHKSSDLTIYSRIKPYSGWDSRVAITKSYFDSRDILNGTPGGSFEGDQLGLQWSNTYKFGAGSAIFGIDSINSKFETPTIYERNSRGYYLGFNGRLDLLDYQVNLRRDDIESKNIDEPNTQTKNTWLVGTGYHLTDTVKLVGLVSTAFRAPAVGDLYGDYGNPNLQPQEHQGRELGVQYQGMLGSLRAVYFTTETKNDFGYGLDYKPYNITTSVNKGVELDFNGYLAGWNYELNTVFQDPHNPETDIPRARRAKNYGSFVLSKSVFGLDLGTKISWAGKRKDIDYDPDKRFNGSYTVVNLTASKKLSPEWTGRVKLENAFNEDYQLAYGYNTPPRGVFVTLQYQPR